MMTPTFLERFKCEFKNGINEKNKIKLGYTPVATLLWPSVGVKPNTWKK
jgi:hypothetical protein